MQSKDLHELTSRSCQAQRSGPLEQACGTQNSGRLGQKELSAGLCMLPGL